MTLPIIQDLRRERRAREMSQRDIAKALGISHAAISVFETGVKYPRLINFIQWAAILGYDVKLEKKNG